MLLYSPKAINYGFVIICPNCNTGQVKTTINSIKCNYAATKFVCVVPSGCHEDDLKEIGKLCQVVRGGETVTSLINAGMEAALCDEWNFIVIGGSWVRGFLDRKYSHFIESDRDILFPVVERKTNFVDGSINGILLHKKAWKIVGPFSSKNPLEICKLMWSLAAIEKKLQFKAVLGGSVC